MDFTEGAKELQTNCQNNEASCEAVLEQEPVTETFVEGDRLIEMEVTHDEFQSEQSEESHEEIDFNVKETDGTENDLG